ncbi:MAG TPA: hypothetical protein VIU45_02580 [Chitinophagaceae bacterium]
MNATDININLIEAYFRLLKNLNPDSKLELISKLSNSMRTAKTAKRESLKPLYGAFISNQSADELIDDIKQARTFNRKRAEL